MIPNRIFLSGFLCYRAAQEVCFDGRTLWMLAGPNGSGKSALFDAVTYVLFGQHRGGKHNARGLIHHACDSFALEFDFTLDEKRYRARRTLTRQGRGTRQVDTWTAGPGQPAGMWQAIPETQTEKGFAQWIDTHVALTYDTFTASVLLLQGQAENLLMAAPAERHRLLSQIVGLARIEELHERARQQLARSQGAARSLRQQTTQLPPVAASQLSSLQDTARTAENDHSAQVVRLTHLTRSLEQARRWQELTLLEKRLESELQQAATLVPTLQRTEQQHARWIELGTQLEVLARFVQCIQQTTLCRAHMAAKQAELEDLEPQLQLANSDILEAEQSLAAARQQLTYDMAAKSSLTVRHAELQRDYWATARFTQVRDKLQQTDESLADIERQVTILRQQRTDTDRGRPADHTVQLAQVAVRKAAEELARCEALAERARQQLHRFQTVAAEQVCAYCLQPLSATHVQREQTRLTDELRRSEELAERADCQLRETEARHHSLQQQRDAHQMRCDALEQQLKQLVISLQAGTLARQDLTAQYSQAYQELPAALQSDAAAKEPPAWNDTRCPTNNDLSQLAHSLTELRQTLSDTSHSLCEHEQAIERLERQGRQSAARGHALQQQKQRLNDQLTLATGRLAGLTEVHAAARQTVPAQWRESGAEELLALVAQLEDERGHLAAAGEVGRQHDIERALDRQRECRSQHDLVLQQLADIPVDARRAPQDIERSIQEATHTLKCHERALKDAREREARARADYDYRAATQRKLRDAQQDEYLWKRLVELLGRDGLQRDLLRGAEVAIVEYANAILDRLAGGRLYVELAQPATGRSGTPKVLDLLARTTGDAAAVQDVAFLSGSQKFRVAVALSLAIGQFASNTRRPVQAVIIDEGFGCLDSVNRQVMIQELQNLKGHLKRIVLVSHQDEFASAFPDGYHCELVHGTTRLTPFHP